MPRNKPQTILALNLNGRAGKKAQKIVEKVTNKYDGNYRQLADAARTGITPKTFAETDAFIQALSEKFHLVDEGWSLPDAGYFDRKLMVIFDDKSLGEIQIWPPKMLDAKSVRVKSAQKPIMLILSSKNLATIIMTCPKQTWHGPEMVSDANPHERTVWVSNKRN
jgi:hypothetical protein